MFNKNKAEEANSSLRVMNQLGQGTVLYGDISTEGDIRIDGTVNGSITSKAKTVIGATGIVEGDVFCQNAYVDGRVNGNIEVSELLILSKTALVTGDIRIKKLVVEEGAQFNGLCSMGTSAGRETQHTPNAHPKKVE